MKYQTYKPTPDLASLVSCYWTLEAPAMPEVQRQRIVPDGTLEMAFILADDIKRFTCGDDYILQPRAMVLGQTIAPFYIEPTGAVNTLAVRFYPHAFANLVEVPIKTLANKETPLEELFDRTESKQLHLEIVNAKDTEQRITTIESYLLGKLTQPATVDSIVQSTIDSLMASKGGASIDGMVDRDPAKRRQLERKFAKQIGVSPKQLGKVIRLQSALKMMLNGEEDRLTDVASASEYYDQAHFIKDFKEFTGVRPKEFLSSESMQLSALFYK